MREYQLGIIGAGNMAEAIVRGVLKAGVLPPDRIIAADPSEQRRAVFERIGTDVTDNNAAAAAPQVLLAVKPQMMDEVLPALAESIGTDALVISIAAGVKTASLDAALGGKSRIVRVMPNTPMLVGAGVSALCPGPRATDNDLVWVEALLSASGCVLRVDESDMDAVTAVSGSGPAYFFYLVEAMIAAGVAEGLSPEAAALLAGATCRGAGEMLLAGDESAGTLRAKVTSPGGTTQRAIETMDAENVQTALTRAVRAAAQRSRELGG
ncbi:MAG: pyrroline-5-carboxylate reductase [Phycisphaerae bacterium]